MNEQEWNMTDAMPNPLACSAPTLPAEIAREVSVIRKRYPKIGETITKLWGSVDLYAYLKFNHF
jgi:hypothetical protein